MTKDERQAVERADEAIAKAELFTEAVKDFRSHAFAYGSTPFAPETYRAVADRALHDLRHALDELGYSLDALNPDPAVIAARKKWSTT